MDEAAVLAAYGEAMRSAQWFESRLKILFNLHHLSANFPDEEFDKLLSSGDEYTAGKAFGALIDELKRAGLSPLPSVAINGFRQTIKLRNSLAHHYFIYFGLLSDDEAVQQQLVAQLHAYSEVFRSWLPVLDKWIDRMLGALGVTAEEVDMQLVEQYRTEFRDSLIDDLRRSIQDLAPDENGAEEK